MNEIFDFSRFWKYFKYDFFGSLRNNKVKLASYLLSPIAIFLIVNVITLIFNHHWIEGTAFRTTMFVVLSISFIMYYPTLCYGFLTDKKPASAWLMIPVSTTEKYVSMLLNALIIVPVCFFACYFVLDAVVCLLPHAGTPVFSLMNSGNVHLINFDNGDGILKINLFSQVILYICAVGNVLLSFLLGAIVFKKNKIANTIIASFLISSAMIAIIAFLVWVFGGFSINNFEAFIEDADTKIRLATFILNAFLTLFIVVPFIALATGVYYRLKTIKH